MLISKILPEFFKSRFQVTRGESYLAKPCNIRELFTSILKKYCCIAEAKTPLE